MLQVPIEILIVDKDDIKNQEYVKEAIAVLHEIQNTFKYSILNNIDITHKIHDSKQVNKVDVYDFLDRYKSTIKGYHPHLIGVIDKFLIGDELTNLFATLERKTGILSGNGIITSYEVQGLIEKVPMPIYLMFYLLINPLRFLLKERIGHREARICIYDTKVNKNDIYKILKYGAFCLECNDKIRGVLSVQEMKSVREVLGFISDVANSNNPEHYFENSVQNFKISTNNLNQEAINNQKLEEAIELLRQSRIEDAFDKVSLSIKIKFPEYYEQTIILFSRLNKLKLEKRMGVIGREDELLESNKINNDYPHIVPQLYKTLKTNNLCPKPKCARSTFMIMFTNI